MLARCPYCGSDNLDDTCGAHDGIRSFYFVFCNDCEAEGPTDCDQAKAIELWNQRLTGDDFDSSREELVREQ